MENLNYTGNGPISKESHRTDSGASMWTHHSYLRERQFNTHSPIFLFLLIYFGAIKKTSLLFKVLHLFFPH